MKQNTKFLWMYVCILVSFAVILIVFAGLSTNKNLGKEKGLSNKVELLSNENKELQNKVKELETASTQTNAQMTILKDQNTALLNENVSYKIVVDNDKALESALAEYNVGNKSKCKEFLGQIDKTKLTLSQTYLYDLLMK